MLPQQTVVDDFLTQDIPLFQGVFTYYRNKPQPVRGRVHQAEERYFEKHEIIPMTTSKGIQTYVMLHPYVFEPKLTLTVGLYKKPKQVADIGEQVGEVVSSKQEGVREVEVGKCQAWYYHEDRILVLWECFLESFVRNQPLLKDPNMKHLWQSVEQYLLAQFPQAKQVVTPFDDPLFERKEYQTFLRSFGYQPEPGAKAAFGKILT